MQPLENSIISFIHEELGAESYQSSGDHFQDHSIESFQVLEIVLEIERQIGKRLSLQELKPEALFSLKGLLQHLCPEAAA